MFTRVLTAALAVMVAAGCGAKAPSDDASSARATPRATHGITPEPGPQQSSSCAAASGDDAAAPDQDSHPECADDRGWRPDAADEPNPAAANAVQEGLGRQFGEMRTLMQYLFQSINFRGDARLEALQGPDFRVPVTTDQSRGVDRDHHARSSTVPPGTRA